MSTWRPRPLPPSAMRANPAPRWSGKGGPAKGGFVTGGSAPASVAGGPGRRGRGGGGEGGIRHGRVGARVDGGAAGQQGHGRRRPAVAPERPEPGIAHVEQVAGAVAGGEAARAAGAEEVVRAPRVQGGAGHVVGG